MLRISSRAFVLALSLFVSWSLSSVAQAAPVDGGPVEQDVMLRSMRGVYFVENQGQWSDSSVRFGLRSRGLDVGFGESSFSMHMSREVGAWASRPSELPAARDTSPDREGADVGSTLHEEFLADASGSLRTTGGYEQLTLTISFPGSNDVTPIGAELQAAKFNYFVGGEGRGVASGVPSFGSVVYENLYDGIDLFVCGSDRGVLKYEFHVEPGANYSQIAISYDGVDSLCVDNDGGLQIATSFGVLRDVAPVVWQGGDGGEGAQSEQAGKPIPPRIPVRFELVDGRTYRIAIDGEVDSSRALVIDPDVEWMRYLGGGDYEEGFCIDVDSAGNILVTGYTYSTDFRGRNNSYHGGFDEDAFALKTSPSGELLWMTYLGGRRSDEAWGIAADSDGNVLVGGYTSSTDFEGRSNSFYGGNFDSFVVKINPDGQLQWMIYAGGSADDRGLGIAVDSIGNSLLTGVTRSSDFEGANNTSYGYNDAFVAKVDTHGQLDWMTFLGGSIDDWAFGINVDSDDNALVTGRTNSPGFDGRTNWHHGSDDIFVVKVRPTGQLAWMTFAGGSGTELGWHVTADSAGNVLVTGITWSSDFERRTNFYHGGYGGDALALETSPTGEILWMTYLGGDGWEEGRGVALDDDDHVIVTGTTRSTDFDRRTNSHFGGVDDVFILVVSRSGELLQMSYVGGSAGDFGAGIVVDGAGEMLISGTTTSIDFVRRINSHHGGFADAFVARLNHANYPRLTVRSNCPNDEPIQISWSGSTPSGRAALLYARNTGSFSVPKNRPCSGTILGLGSQHLQIAFTGQSDFNGSRTLNRSVGPKACGGYLQLVDLETCGISNLARIE